MDISDLRREFTHTGLERENLNPNPFLQFEQWFQQAEQAGLDQPNAMSLATADAGGMVSIRTVLLKLFDEDGFVFYTNYGSHKARDIAVNPKVALLFPWLLLDRQVKIQGYAEKVSTAESFSYFTRRPRGSQLGAWSSAQSRVVSSRSLLEGEFQKLKDKFLHREIPLPDFWGGYRVVPNTLEFWQGRENRMHDRFRFTRRDSADWLIERLAP